ncbi:MAG: anti-sigma factor antagonist [Clostridia bacterium]|nr:anti-sigma factor antagonist [Clostridia bacterium]
MKEEVTFSARGRTLEARILSEIDHHTARRIRERIDSRLFLDKPDVLIMDFSSVRFMDSSGLGLILGRVERASGLGSTVRLTGLSDTLYKLIRLSGLERVKNLSVVK